MPRPQRFTTLIFDLGDVLFAWSSNTTTSISSRTLRQILQCPTWFEYECGRISEEECYARVGSEFSITPEEVAHAFEQARESLQSNQDMIALIRELKAESDGALRVYAMSNISAPDYEFLRRERTETDWSIFDRIFTSAAAGARKPNLGFYKHVLTETGADPHATIFVDDKADNVLSARSFGIHGIVFDDQEKVKRALRNLIGNPVQRGRAFLQERAGQLETTTDGGVVLNENFTQLLILELTGDRSLVKVVDHPRTWNYFVGKPMLTTEEFPFDLDTTSLGLTIMDSKPDVVTSVMDEMMEYVDHDGVIQTYFDHTRPRIDPVVCTNVLSLFYSNGRGSDLIRTLHWVRDVLDNRAYLDGTRYYASGECFLYFTHRLLAQSDDSLLHNLLEPLLRERVQERIGTEGDALALAMRVLVCASFGIRDRIDMHALLPRQCIDGGWEDAWVYRMGSSNVRIGSRGLTTAMAIRAIEAYERLPTRASSDSSRSSSERMSHRHALSDPLSVVSAQSPPPFEVAFPITTSPRPAEHTLSPPITDVTRPSTPPPVLPAGRPQSPFKPGSPRRLLQRLWRRSLISPGQAVSAR